MCDTSRRVKCSQAEALTGPIHSRFEKNLGVKQKDRVANFITSSLKLPWRVKIR
ncbi:hypothetical protein GYMLUDRAFT_76275 [Collybiopsis luxurians FD-317 M1]|uniref:Uncharacterized protein n=1 Tax=Collybiopsis luxurians FD-317 M1 TaxID=944289 RepID=A0A0D0CDM5_9AGAR|nr:hypothetical protein GYMLUDRAFT_76275 [Collybiopsis luxurians FD-317 M1]